MARRKVASAAPARMKVEPQRDVLRAMNGSTALIPLDAVYHVPAVHPDEDGPWESEADKIAWTDELSGLQCILRRSKYTGCWEGFVGVGPDHQLFHAARGALVGLGIQVHGGINYAAPCQHQDPEEVSVCHVDVSHAKAIFADGAAGKGHTDAWWFGFACDQDTDIMPTNCYRRRAAEQLGGSDERVYRDEAFAYRECVHLAAQLRAIAIGKDPREVNWRRARTSSANVLPAPKGW